VIQKQKMKNKMVWIILAISIGFAIIVSGVAVGMAYDTNTEMTNSAEGTHVVIQAFDQNPAGNYSTNRYEWVKLYNPTNKSEDISGWTISSKGYYGGRGFRIINISKNYMTFIPGKSWLRDKDEKIVLTDTEGNIIDETLNASDGDNNNRYWKRHPVGFDIDSDTDWQFGWLQTLDKGGLRRGTVKYVHDGDTIHISPVSSKATEFITYNATQHLIPIPPYSITNEGKIYSSPVGMAGIQSVRLDGIDAPELGTEEGNKSKRVLEQLCLGKEVVFDVDDCRQYDKYDRILAMVYANGTNVNQEMLINGSAIPLIITPSEFVPYANYTYTPLKLNPVVNQSIAFNASSSWTFDPAAAIISYEWRFGDGTNGTGKITNHTYLSPGNYTVCLEVTDSDGKERRCNAVDMTLMVYLTESQPPIAGTPLLRCGC
jgi:endonuclease YncB( thermonuclease family)